MTIKRRDEVRPGEVFVYARGRGIPYYQAPRHSAMPTWHAAERIIESLGSSTPWADVLVVWSPPLVEIEAPLDLLAFALWMWTSPFRPLYIMPNAWPRWIHANPDQTFHFILC